MITKKKPLIVIAGPTASGKTTLAVEISEQFGGEIICADSRTVYKGLDIGTAKPTSKDRERVPHWGLDLVNPGDYFSVADFKEYAQKKIEEIRTRGNFPFLVGGTGLYIDSILFDYKFGEKADISRRNLLNTMTLDQLHDYCNKNNILLPENKRNKKSIIVRKTTEKTVLRKKNESKIEQLFDNGVVEEAKKLGEKYGWNN